ncbi:hypothetical protein PF008_g4830 [Phytophthora fragariae]|uniref:Uncharacterized protein n=1 Tax=Phytophthora fragariae TaxID=53985 RepID=A0A6G0SA54_9STRA|nr:hypothetical protein PF008_g4830 [Phytophthora fragariae]
MGKFVGGDIASDTDSATASVAAWKILPLLRSGLCPGAHRKDRPARRAFPANKFTPRSSFSQLLDVDVSAATAPDATGCAPSGA